MQIKTNDLLYPGVTKHHVELMLHAIGLDDERPKRSRIGEYYYPYRNYYDAGSESKAWEELIALGYACKSSDAMYHITLLGLNTLSNVTGVNIYNSVARYKSTTQVAVLEFLCKTDVFCGYGCWIPVSCKECAAQTCIPLHKVREAMRALVEQGYVCKTHYSGYDDNKLVPVYMRGYGCTEKARSTDLYKMAREKEVRRMKEMMEREENE